MNISSNKEIDNLLIIGNGFDLHCNLASKFSDYYEKNCLTIVKT